MAPSIISPPHTTTFLYSILIKLLRYLATIPILSLRHDHCHLQSQDHTSPLKHTIRNTYFRHHMNQLTLHQNQSSTFLIQTIRYHNYCPSRLTRQSRHQYRKSTILSQSLRYHISCYLVSTQHLRYQDHKYPILIQTLRYHNSCHTVLTQLLKYQDSPSTILIHSRYHYYCHILPTQH